MKFIIYFTVILNVFSLYGQKNKLTINQKTFPVGTNFYNIKFANVRKLDRVMGTRIGNKIIFNNDATNFFYGYIYHNFDTILSLRTIQFSTYNNSYNYVNFGFDNLYITPCDIDTIQKIFKQIRTSSEYVKEKKNKIKKIKSKKGFLKAQDLNNYEKDCLKNILKKTNEALSQKNELDPYVRGNIKRNYETVLFYYKLFDIEDYVTDDTLQYIKGNSLVYEVFLFEKSVEELIILEENLSKNDELYKLLIVNKTLYIKTGGRDYWNNFKWLSSSLKDD